MPGPTFSGIILAGGSNSRMGRDKATLPVGSESVLERTVRLLGEICAQVLVVGREGDGPAGARSLPDEHPGGGPLGGLVTGLRAMQDEYALLVACDMPLLSAAALGALADRAPGYDAVVPVVEGQSQPLHAVYGVDCLPPAECQLAHGERRMRVLLESLAVRWVDESELRPLDPQLHSFRNVNTPDDWTALQKLLDR